MRTYNSIALSLLILLSLTLSANAYLEKCSNIYYQYPYFTMMPIFVGKTLVQDETTHQIDGIIGNCFDSISIKTKFTFLNNRRDQIRAEITLNLDSPYYLMCTEHFAIGTTFNDKYEAYFFKGEKTITLDFTKDSDFIDLLANGLQFFTFCADQLTILSTSMQTKNLFAGGFGSSKYIPFVGSKIPDYIQWANYDFLQKFMETSLERRVIQQVEIDKKNIKSGDLLFARRFDGVDPFYMVSTGSHVAHAAIALWEDNELYVVESQDAWYFETQFSGVQRNTYDDWMDWAEDADYEVVWVQLNAEKRQAFDTKKAWQFFKKNDGAQYGHRIQLFSIIDTEEDNYFEPMSGELLPFMIRYIQEIYPTLFTKFFREGLNKRLGNHNDEDMHDNLEDVILHALAEKNMTINQLMAVPEEDIWEYTDGQAYTAASFIISLYRSVGLFGDVQVNAKEFTVKDLYQLNFFETSKYSYPEACAEADPHIPYCQLLGDYRVYLTGLSSIQPYNHMNEKCPSKAPVFYRPYDC